MSNSSIRPQLRQVSPGVHASCVTFAFLNIFFLAPTFYITNGNKGLPLVGAIPSPIWGSLFLVSGILMLTALSFNHWRSIKSLLVFGLLLKAAFAWALVIILVGNFRNLGLVGLWLSLMVWQALCIIYFTPELKNGNFGVQQ